MRWSTEMYIEFFLLEERMQECVCLEASGRALCGHGERTNVTEYVGNGGRRMKLIECGSKRAPFQYPSPGLRISQAGFPCKEPCFLRCPLSLTHGPFLQPTTWAEFSPFHLSGSLTQTLLRPSSTLKHPRVYAGPPG